MPLLISLNKEFQSQSLPPLIKIPGSIVVTNPEALRLQLDISTLPVLSQCFTRSVGSCKSTILALEAGSLFCEFVDPDCCAVFKPRR